MTIYIVLPAYNEEESLPPLLDRIEELRLSWPTALRVIIVDDGSSDGTARVAAAHRLAELGLLEVVPHPHNMGLAAAVRTGIRAFLDRSNSDTDVMVTMDADNTHDPVYIPQLIEKTSGGAGVAICSRFVAGGEERGVNAFRKLLSRGAKSFMDMLAPIPNVKDISCGYRCYPRPALDRASRIFGAHLIQSVGGSVQAELLVRLTATGERAEESPFILRYDLKKGPSKLGMLKTIKGYFALRRIRNQSVAEAALMGSAPAEPPEASDVVVQVCTYNESDNIRLLIPAIFSALPGAAALVVDDGSPDGTGDIAENFKKQYPRLHVIHRAGKLGLGTAITEGFRWAKQNGFRAVINMDADFSHDPVMLPWFVRRAADADYVAGSRYVPGGGTLNWGFHRRLLSRFANAFARTILQVPVRDLTTGYRLVKTGCIDSLGLDSIAAKGYGYLIGMTFRAARSGLRISEVPIRFLDRQYGASKMSISIIREALLMVIRLRRELKKK